MRGSITGQAIRARVDRAHPRYGPAGDRRPVILAPVLDRPRAVLLGWAAVCFALFALLAARGDPGLGPAGPARRPGRPAPRQWAVDAGWLQHPLPGRRGRLRHHRRASSSPPVLAVADAGCKGHRRAAVFTVGVMIATAAGHDGAKPLVGRDRPTWQITEDLLSSQGLPLRARRRRSPRSPASWPCWSRCSYGARNLRRAAYVGAGAARGRGLPRPGPARPALPLRRGRRGPAGHRDRAARAGGSTARCRAATPIKRRAAPGGRALATRRLAVDPQPDQGRGRRPVPGDRRRDGRRGRLVGADLALHDRRGPRHRHGRGRRRSPAPTWCSCAAATARCARCAPSWPAPASRSGSSPPAPATCWPATSTSRSTCARRSTSALTGQDRAIDMVEVSGDGFEDTHFMVMAGMGFDAAIMEGVNEDIKKKVGWLAYVLSALKSLMFPAGPGRDLGRRRRVHQAPRPHGRGRQRRLPAGRDAAAPRRRHRRRPARRRDPAPAQLPLLDPAGLAGARQAAAHRRHWSTG